MLSPGRTRLFSRFHSSGRWFFGSHWPLASRSEKMRSLARERSSSRRAPPNAASKPPASSASSSDLVLSRPQQRCVPTTNGCVPSAIASWLVWTISRAPISSAYQSRNVDHLAELVGRVDVEQRKRNRRRVERLLREAQQHRGVLADRVEHDRPLELRDDFPDDVNALRLERAQVIQARRRGDTWSFHRWQQHSKTPSAHGGTRRQTTGVVGLEGQRPTGGET